MPKSSTICWKIRDSSTEKSGLSPSFVVCAASVFIPYGAKIDAVEGRETLDALGLSEREYFLYVSRFEPENNPLIVVKAFERVRTSKKLVMVGDAPYAARYIEQVRATRDARILFPGTIYGRGYQQLQMKATPSRTLSPNCTRLRS